MGLQLLEREKALFSSTQKTQPQLKGKEFILQRHLKPSLCKSLFAIMQQEDIVPTSLCFLTSGLAHGVLALANASGCGAKVYVNKIPIASQTFEMAQELNFDALVCALNGGDDYEFLFTAPLALHETLSKELPVDIIGHLCDASYGTLLVTPEGNTIPLTAPGWGEGGSIDS
jgi:thiamine-monophosphate kinase